MVESNGDSLDDILKRVRPRGQARPEPEPLEIDDDTDAISLADMNGSHVMRPANKNLTRIHVMLRDGKVRSFQYAYFDVESRFEGGTFVLVFAGTRHWEITVKGHGPKFWMVYDLCTLHRCPYLREATNDFGEAAGTVISEIRIRDITPRAEDE